MRRGVVPATLGCQYLCVYTRRQVVTILALRITINPNSAVGLLRLVY